MTEVKHVNDPESLAIVHEIRRIVFVIEQACPPELEYEYEEESHHFLATVDRVPAGVCRWRQTENGYKLERFAVLKEYRGKGVGAALLKTVIDDLPSDANLIYLHAQLTAKDFYLKYGFVPMGDNFWEAGIEHVKMKLA